MRFIDLTGQRFGRWLVENRASDVSGRSAWNCICDCGNTRVVVGNSLRGGRTISCGCIKKVLSSRLVDLTGQKFGRLYVEKRAENNGKTVMWNCSCDCGNSKKVAGALLKNGSTKSCGCYNDENRRAVNTTHGKSKTSLYRIFATMKDRCYRKNNKDYSQYGGRGISICNEWLESFQIFYNWAILNGYKKGLEIDRIDVNGNYEPSNCRWAVRVVQNRNQRNRKDNASGTRGVRFNKDNQKWHTRISVNKKEKHIGYFNTLEEATQARKEAEQKYWT